MTHQFLLRRIGLAMALISLVAWASASAQTPGVTDGTLNVALSEWSMGFSRAKASNGRLALTVKNAGAYRHNLRIVNQAGAVLYKSRVLSPGQSQRASLNISAGTYTLYCSIPGHRGAGMVGTLTVGG